MFYAENLISKQDYMDLMLEIEAYRNIDGENFDFGTGLIVNEMSYGSEDAYYEMDIQMLEDIIEHWELDNIVTKSRKKPKTHKRHLRKRQNNRLKKLLHSSPSLAVQKDGWIKRCYPNHQTFHPKKVSNKKVRRYQNEFPSKGSFHHKICSLDN